MNPRRKMPKRARHSSQSGYAFLFALFLMLAMLAGSVVVIQNGLTQSRRRREEEMIWRGNQYKRAIRLYFHKTGHYPQNFDELAKGLPQLHFLRQPYKDPMNVTDGKWRFIYVNAAGQIIGSTRYASLQQMALIENPSLMAASSFPQLGVSASSLANQSSAFGSSAFGSQPAQNPAPGTSSTPPAGSTPNPGTDPSGQSGQNPPADQSGQGASGTSTSTSAFGQSGQSSAFGSSGQLGNPILQQKPTGAVDGPVLGGFLTGVGSGNKSDAESLKVLHGAKKYKDWEFIWNPLEDQAAATQQAIGAATQQGVGGALNPFGGANPFGPQPQQPTNQPQPQPQPSPTPQNPQ
jgi:hypothetical protein